MDARRKALLSAEASQLLGFMTIHIDDDTDEIIEEFRGRATVADQGNNLIQGLEQSGTKGAKCNKEKAKLRQSSMRQMGHLWIADGLKADPERAKAVVNMPKPKNVMEVQRLVGFVDLFRKIFILTVNNM